MELVISVGSDDATRICANATGHAVRVLHVFDRDAAYSLLLDGLTNGSGGVDLLSLAGRLADGGF